VRGREGMIAAVEELVLDRPLLLILGVIIVAVGLAYYLYAAVTLAVGVYLTLAGFKPAPRVP
jgi:hypothetical protein